MGRRKIEIKAIKDDRNRSVYALPPSALAPAANPRQHLPEAQGRPIQEGA